MSRFNPRKTQMKLPQELTVNPMFTRQGQRRIPRFQMHDKSMLPETAYQIVHDELQLDGNTRLNLASFVTTWMEPSANQLYAETFDKNIIDRDEYPQTSAIEERCIRILANLWHSPHPMSTMGVSTTGSSEGCMLGGLALKRRWQHARQKQGKSTSKPNIVFSSAVQVVWKKFANYWDIEPRYVNVTKDRPYLDPAKVAQFVDENTIGVIPILGVTYTGLYDPVADIAKALDDVEAKTGLDIPMHVDAASGGFVAPFLQPNLTWDFRIPRVKSINVSGHKYGLVYPGVGWVVWRKAEDLPDDLIFHISYLGGNMPTFGLNFSRPAGEVLLQYYNFLRLGKEGYYEVQKSCQSVATFLSSEIAKVEPFQILTRGIDIPVITWRMKRGYQWTLQDLSHELRKYGWQVPAYTMPPDLEHITVMRVVVRNGFSVDLAHMFLMDLKQAVTQLQSANGTQAHDRTKSTGFHH